MKRKYTIIRLKSDPSQILHFGAEPASYTPFDDSLFEAVPDYLPDDWSQVLIAKGEDLAGDLYAQLSKMPIATADNLVLQDVLDKYRAFLASHRSNPLSKSRLDELLAVMANNGVPADFATVINAFVSEWRQSRIFLSDDYISSLHAATA